MFSDEGLLALLQPRLQETKGQIESWTPIYEGNVLYAGMLFHITARVSFL